MATTPAYALTQQDPKPNVNLFPTFMTFNKSVDYTGWDNTAGSGIGANDASLFAFGDRALDLYSTNDSAACEFSSGGTQTRVTATKTARYMVQFWIYNPDTGCTAGDIYILKLAKNGVGAWKEISVSAEQLGGVTNKWIPFWMDFALSAGDYIDVIHVLPANAVYPVGGAHSVKVDGFKFECDDRLVGFPSVYTEPFIPVNQIPTTDGFYMMRADLSYPSLVKVIDGTAVLDFPSAGSGSTHTLTATLTGAAVGQKVEVTEPSAIYAAGVTYQGYCTATDTVEITMINHSGSSFNPASATFKLRIYPNV